MAAKKPAKSGRARKKPRKKVSAKAAGKGAEPKLYTLTQIGEMASISMPTLQKYKRLYQDRIPSVGEGRKQRYPREAVAVFKELKKENLAKRGRPPKSAAGAKKTTAKKRSARKTAAESKDLLTLTDISKITNISYPTVSRYVKLFLDRIPHVGAGRLRRFPSEAVDVFRQLRSESKPGRPPKKGKAGAGRTAADASASSAALLARLERLEKAQGQLSKQVTDMVKLLKKPLQVTIKGR